ncbi:MAG: NlpC/P60 family protein [Rhizomicrobium sp.]|nr:NlpC/P60 family protein [Rhizomicrobium sp.]
MAIDLITSARRWIGTPYVHQASLQGVGSDCLGFIRGLYRERCGEEAEDIPPYDPAWDLGSESLRDGFARHLDEIALSTIAPGDIVLFRMVPGASARHCGLLAEQDGHLTLIHARQNKRVSEERFTTFWRRKAAYAFRF